MLRAKWYLLLLPVGLALAAPSSSRADSKFTLGRAIPADCWMYVHGVHNPEREFLDKHWAKVIKAFNDSGIVGEIKKLIISNLPEEERQGFGDKWTQAGEICHEMNWRSLVSKEFVYAQRMLPAMPDHIFLCRGEEKDVEANVANLRKMFNFAAELFSGNAVVEDEEVQGVKVVTLKPKMEEIPISFHMFYVKDVIGFSMGRRGMEDIVGMLTGKSKAKSVVELDKFKQQVAKLPEPEDSVAYFDVSMMLTNLRSYIKMGASGRPASDRPAAARVNDADDPAKPAEEGKQPDDEQAMIMKLVDKVFDQLDFMDVIVISEQTDKLQTDTYSRAVIKEGGTEKPLCKALLAGKPIEKFDRFIPQTAVDFSVWQGMDLKGLYHTVLDFIGRNAPEGKELLAQWERTQEEIGFNPDKDLFSWLGGPMISLTMEGDQFAMLVGVTDEKVAREKLAVGLEKLNGLLNQTVGGFTLTPATKIKPEGFQVIMHPMAAMMGGLSPVVGVADGYLWLASNEDTVIASMAVAAGEAKSVKENKRFQQEGIIPKGPVCSVSFTDQTKLAETLSQVFGMMGMFSGFIPSDDPGAEAVKTVMNIVGRLSIVAAQLDFFMSTSSVCEYDKGVWISHARVQYRPAEPKLEAAPVEEKPADRTPENENKATEEGSRHKP